jgi:hypothetical protein
MCTFVTRETSERALFTFWLSVPQDLMQVKAASSLHLACRKDFEWYIALARPSLPEILKQLEPHGLMLEAKSGGKLLLDSHSQTLVNTRHIVTNFGLSTLEPPSPVFSYFPHFSGERLPRWASCLSFIGLSMHDLKGALRCAIAELRMEVYRVRITKHSS